MDQAGGTQAAAILDFYRNLRPGGRLNNGIGIMNPYLDKAAWAATEQFYRKYYGDNLPRAFIFGITPICSLLSFTKTFYGQYHFTALSPLGFVREGKNLNYYDDKELIRALEPFILHCIRRQLATMPTYPVCYCLGEGENYKYFSRVNDRHGFFREIIPLPHPRWVMQYRRKRIGEFVTLYKEKLSAFDRPGPPANG